LRYWNGLTISIQAFFVLLLSLIAVFAFSNSFVFPPLLSVISKLNAFEPVHISIILAGILVLVGSIQVIVRTEPNVGSFISLTVILLTPSVVATTNIDWAQIMGWQLDTELALPQGLVFLFTALSVIGYIVLRLTIQHNSSALTASAHGFDKKEISTAYFKKHIWGFLMIASAAIIVLLIYLSSNYIGQALGVIFPQISVDILVVGILCIIVLIAVAYAFLVRGRLPFGTRPTTKTDGNNTSVTSEQDSSEESNLQI